MISTLPKEEGFVTCRSRMRFDASVCAPRRCFPPSMPHTCPCLHKARCLLAFSSCVLDQCLTASFDNSPVSLAAR
jgi:hypothetical protein